jgi:hypothetical protein
MHNSQSAGSTEPGYAGNGHRLVALGPSDIPVILTLENACWLPGIRATAEILETRFGMGHISLGMRINDTLVGIVSFSYTRFSPDEPAGLPASFHEFSSRPMANDHNTAFAYNLNIHPRARGGTLTRDLLWAGLNRMREDGCQYLLGVGRCPSYNGSTGGEVENIQPSPALRHAIDEFMRSGRQPTPEQLLADPVLKFYWYSLGCDFLRVVPNFLPCDTPSGGFGVIFYKTL